MKAPPKWAQNLLLEAAVHVGYEGPLTLKWRRSQRKWLEGTTGHTKVDSKEIVLTAGSKRLPQKVILLHEAAHLFTGDWHTARFWDMAWTLYRWAKLPMRKVKQSEGTYRKGALVAYARSTKPKE